MRPNGYFFNFHFLKTFISYSTTNSTRHKKFNLSTIDLQQIYVESRDKLLKLFCENNNTNALSCFS
jgi:hypothetical protein